jgi:hypothetical protein
MKLSYCIMRSIENQETKFSSHQAKMIYFSNYKLIKGYTQTRVLQITCNKFKNRNLAKVLKKLYLYIAELVTIGSISLQDCQSLNKQGLTKDRQSQGKLHLPVAPENQGMKFPPQ